MTLEAILPATDTSPTATPSGQRALRAVAATAPVVVALLVVWHPVDPVDPMDLVDRATSWIWLHVGLLVALPMLAATVWWLVHGMTSRAATVARVVLAPALVFYAAFDSLVGIGTGLLAREVANAEPADLEAAGRVLAAWWEVPAVVGIISAVAQLTWVVALGATTRAHLRAGSPRPLIAALCVTLVTFPLLHFRPVGLVAMASLLAAVVMVARTRRAR